jgi:hypothetical protein
MSTTSGGPNNVNNGLVLHLDAANTKSFRGIPTTNLTINSRNFSGTSYSTDGEWTPDPTRLTKTYVSGLSTPVGLGATLIEESGVNGYHHLSRWGGGDESGTHSLSCYVYPLSNTITEFTIGMLGDGNNVIIFNLNTKSITYGAFISNRNAFIEDVPNWPGWLRVGANFEGRGGGWVGSIGYSAYVTYTGTAGGKRSYITGVQYEYTAAPTPFIEAQQSRGATVATGGGWADRTFNQNHGELINGVTYNSANGGSLVFDGTNDYISFVTNTTLSSSFSMECFIYINSRTNGDIISSWNNPFRFLWRVNNDGYQLIAWNGGGSQTTIGTSIVNVGTWSHVVVTYDGTNIRFYNNAVLTDTNAKSFSIANFTAMQIGANTYDNVYFNGRISNAKIYNRTLSAQEVLQNYNAQKSRFGLP